MRTIDRLRAATPVRAATAGLWILLVLVPALAHAGVPRACIHPTYDPLRCARETRLEHRAVLPSARLRALDRQRPALEGRAPLQDVERNALLEAIHDAVRETRRGSR